MMLLIYCIQVCVLLAALMERIVQAQKAINCPNARCGYPCSCNCEKSQSCGDNGQCPNNGPCKSPYFGPGCQYVDLLLNDGDTNNPAFVSDRNHSTCNPDPTATSLHLSFSKPQSFRWFLIYVSNNLTLFHRNFTVNVDTDPSTIKILFRLDDRASLVKCLPPPYGVTNMTIEGPVVPYICTINVSGGRNVALNQFVKQSSNYSQPLFWVKADNSVDGNTKPDVNRGSCSRTDFEKKTIPHWNISFGSDYYLQRIILYNSNVNTSFLWKFNIVIYDYRLKVLQLYEDTSSSALPVYTIVLKLNSPFHAMKIEGDRSPYSFKVLMMCEVQVFAEAACLQNTYGLGCQHKCQCPSRVECDTVFGKCAYTPVYYCPPGTHGDLCELSCSEHCQYNVCDAHSGACLQCFPGYVGKFCDQVCKTGTFGPNCSLNCSENCAEPCDDITGFCSCVEQFSGDMCRECNEGWFGENCTEICSETCLDNLCDNITGECMSCIEHWTGPMCENCEQGWFGENCTSSCPRICPKNQCDNITGKCDSCVGQRIGPKCEDCPPHYYGALCDIHCSASCRNRSCDEVDGICHACIEGYKGEFCKLEIESAYPSFWLLPLIFPFLLMVVCCFLTEGGAVGPEEV